MIDSADMMLPEPARVSPQLTFRPDIEGLRAIAVGLVVLLHAGVTRLSGGYVGVDVFFVISGFLITSLLINEVAVTERVSILGFYARRAKRILPAACLVIAVTVVAAYQQLGPLIGKTTAVDGRWAAFFAANFRSILQGTDYFTRTLPPSPLQHYWSLAVEEQFYFVWPTLLFGLVLLGRRVSRPTFTLRLGLAALFFGSLYWSIHQTSLAPTTAYFSPFTRAWELGAGALIAAFPTVISKAPNALRAVATWLGLAMIGYTAFAFNANTEFPGYAALLPVAGTVLVVAGGIGATRGSARNLLGLPPLRWLGKVSFSIYLWHWPVLIIAEERSSTPLSWEGRVVCVLITLVLSVASYYAIENPLRSTSLLKSKHARTDWEKSRKALAVGAAALIGAVAVSAFTTHQAVLAINSAAVPIDLGASSPTTATTALNAGTPTTIPALEQVFGSAQANVAKAVADGARLRAIPTNLDPPVLQFKQTKPQFDPSCAAQFSDAVPHPCVFGAKTSGKVMYLLGDSHAGEWVTALDQVAQQRGYKLVMLSKSACTMAAVDAPTYQGAPFPECRTWRTAAVAMIVAARPAFVVLAFAHEEVGAGSNDIPVLEAATQTTWRTLATSGARILQIGDNARLREDPGLCLSRPSADPQSCAGTFPEFENSADSNAARASGVGFINVEPWLCVSKEVCPAIIDGRIAYFDRDHISVQYALYLVPLLGAALDYTLS